MGFQLNQNTATLTLNSVAGLYILHSAHFDINFMYYIFIVIILNFRNNVSKPPTNHF